MSVITPPELCTQCERESEYLVPAYWRGDHWLCSDCCYITAYAYDSKGWPDNPLTSENVSEKHTPEPIAELEDSSSVSRETSGVVSKRIARAITPRSLLFVSWETGRGVTSAGRPVRLPPRFTVEQLLEGPVVRGVFLLGERPGGGIDGFHEWRQAPEGWREDGHYLAVPMLPILRYRGPEGERVDVQRAAGWLGEDLVPDPLDMRDGWLLAEKLIAQEFSSGDRRAVLLATAATTGRDLFARSIDYGVEWPCQTEEVQELIRSTTGQGRIEVVSWPGVEEMPGLVEYDGRRMYTALCDRLPSGVAVVKRGDHSADFRPGRYRASWTVPTTWNHVGLLPELTSDGWTYPRRPGSRASGWVDAWELQLARRHGWAVDVVESLVWPDQPSRGPLDRWAEKLRKVTAGVQTVKEERGRVAAAMLRAVTLHGIGSFVGRSQTVNGSVPLDELERVPHGATALRVEGGSLTFGMVHGPAWPEMVHPEWSAAVWARARARLLESPTGSSSRKAGALSVPPETVVGFRTDAVYMTHDPNWPDDGKPGRLRKKSSPHEHTTHPWPRNSLELIAARDRPVSHEVGRAGRDQALAQVRTSRKRTR